MISIFMLKDVLTHITEIPLNSLSAFTIFYHLFWMTIFKIHLNNFLYTSHTHLRDFKYF